MNRLLLLVAGVLAAGCGHSIAYTSLNRPPRPLSPRSIDSVEVFTTAPPPRAYVEVGMFEIEQDTPASDGTPAMVRKLRERAAAIGCDALVVTATTDRVQSVSGNDFGTVRTAPGGGFGHYSGTSHATVNRVRGHRATCVVYKEAGPALLEGSAETTQL